LPRRVATEVEAPLDLYKIVEKFIHRLNYKLVEISRDHAILVKGSKMLTYIGFTNWEYVYRRLKISLKCKRDGKYIYRLDYEFSWLTNVGYLHRGVYMEISKFAKDNILFTKIDSSIR
jgi:hypothetical protein